jgi:uncharacterized RDD family membrane protein YckC
MESVASTQELTPSVDNSLRIARMGDRVFAALLDGATLIPSFVIVVALIALQQHIRGSETGVTLQGGPALEAIFFSTLVWCMYHFVCEAIWGKTTGKEVMAIEVRAEDGAKCGARKSLIRNVIRPIDAIGLYLLGFVVAILSPRNQRIGDKLAGTIVTENPTARRGLAISIWMVENIALGCVAYFLVRTIPKQ